MIFYIEPHDLAPERLVQVLRDNPNILFVSLVTVDLGNNHTDEKIPVQDFLHNLDDYLHKGIQTDGSSVVLPKIADINDAKVDIIRFFGPLVRRLLLQPSRCIQPTDWNADYPLFLVSSLKAGRLALGPQTGRRSARL